MKQLKEICIKKAKEIYGKDLPPRVKKRIEQELLQIRERGMESTFCKMAEIMQQPLFAGKNRYLRGFRGELGASLVAYLCDISPFNPLELPEELVLYPELLFTREKSGSLYINVGERTKKELEKHLEELDIPENVEFYVTPNLTLLEELQRKTEDIYVCSGYETSHRLAPTNIYEFFCRNRWKYVPEFSNNAVAKSIVKKAEGMNTELLTKMIGLLHGTGTWLNNAEVLAETEKNWLKKAISSAEDVYEYLLRHRMPSSQALEITEIVRCGNRCLSVKEYEALRKYSCEEWFLESVAQIQYLFYRSQNLCYALELKRLIYYFNRHRNTYMEIFKQNALLHT